MSLNIFVISMAGSIERRSRIEEQMRSLDLSFEFVDAVNGRDLPPAYLAQKATSRHIIQGGVAATTPPRDWLCTEPRQVCRPDRTEGSAGRGDSGR